MDFDLDDPLGSDDSFFEEPKALTKSPSKNRSPEKKTLDSLLGFTTKSSENIPKADDSFARPKSTVTFEDSKLEGNVKKPMDDWLSDGPKQHDKHKKTDFLEDILSIAPKSRSDKKGTSLEDILKESKANTTTKSSSLKDITVTESQSDFSFTTLPERRRGQRGLGLEDNLGLGLFNDDNQFGDFYNKNKKDVHPKSAETTTKPATGGVPDWLGIGPITTKRAESPALKKPEKTQSQPIVQTQEPPITRQEEDEQTQIQHILPPNQLKQTTTELSPQNINAEIQNTYSSLHQQESLLLVSLQFKRYEEVLKEIQEKQQQIIGKQDKNFQKFVDEYIIKQQMVENNIRLQQEQINKQIQVLISDPVSRTTYATVKTDENEENLSKEEQPHEGLVRKIKMRHDEELFLMEESYKKQMELIEKSAVNVEENLRNEIKNLSSLFEEKVNNLKSNYEEDNAYYKEKLKSMEEQHSNEIKLLKEIHNQKQEELKSEHAIQIDYIKEMKQKETNLLNEGNYLSQKIDTGIEMLGQNVKVLYDIEEKVNRRYDVLAVAREQSIQSKEKENILMKNALEKSRELAENERAQLLSLVRNLELKLAEQNANAQEDRWALQQASATLVARSKAVEREAEYSRNIVDRERDQLKTLKESLLAEQEKMVMQLTEEKLLLASQKAKFETSTKLINNYEVERAKTEATTAIEEAKHIAGRLNEERTLLQRQKSELQSLKHNLAERERELQDKEAELEFLMQDAQKKLKEDKHVLIEAKRMENMYKERMKEMQNQWTLLSGREKKLAEEKMLLSKERLSHYTSMKASKDCVLCNAGGEPQFGKNTFISPYENNFNSKVSDPTAVKIRLDAMDDEESEVSKEGSHGDR